MEVVSANSSFILVFEESHEAAHAFKDWRSQTFQPMKNIVIDVDFPHPGDSTYATSQWESFMQLHKLDLSRRENSETVITSVKALYAAYNYFKTATKSGFWSDDEIKAMVNQYYKFKKCWSKYKIPGRYSIRNRFYLKQRYQNWMANHSILVYLKRSIRFRKMERQ